MIDSANIPVIVGAGEAIERWDGVERASEPLALMENAIRNATFSFRIAQIDSLDVVNVSSWRYQKAALQLAQRLNISPAHCRHGPIGGESPVRLIDEAAQRIANGESRVAVVCGAEAQYSVNRARAEGLRLPWTPLAPAIRDATFWDGYLNPQAITHDVTQPAQVYPLFENAAQAAWSQTPREALVESGAAWAQLSRIAASRVCSWSGSSFSSDDITAPGPDNRSVAWPYTKRMVANPAVNQGAAVILTNLAHARAQGMADDDLIFVWSGAWANEPRDYLMRDSFDHCPAQRAVLQTLQQRAAPRDFQYYELYSCFPIVPKLARRTLALDARASISVTGGLSFFGAPLSNYMTHAAVAMFERLRGRNDALGLLYGQGEFMTKHHALILATSPPGAGQFHGDRCVQPLADEGRRALTLNANFTGEAHVETSTVIYERDGSHRFGVVVARTADGQRVLARVPPADRTTLDQLLDISKSPIGRCGRIAHAADSLQVFSL
jgi:acetyl-CoA C-acetyltransferase